jgi:ATP/ADP translocase
MVPFQNCVWRPHPPFKMATVTKNRKFFNCPLLLYYNSRWAQILTTATWHWVVHYICNELWLANFFNYLWHLFFSGSTGLEADVRYYQLCCHYSSVNIKYFNVFEITRLNLAMGSKFLEWSFKKLIFLYWSEKQNVCHSSFR